MSGSAVPGVSRHPAAALTGAALGLAFILYETTLPFDFTFDARSLAAGWERAVLRPFAAARPGMGGLANATDILANVPFFMPLGFFLASSPLLLRAGRARPWLLALAAAAASLGVETLQLFSASRWTQTTDLITNTLGAGLGIGLALGGGTRLFDRLTAGALRLLREDPGSLLLTGLTAAILVGSLLPFDITLNRRLLLRQLRALSLAAPGADGPPGSVLLAWVGLIKHAWLFSFWGAAAAHWLAARRRGPLPCALAAGCALALLSEAGQLFIRSRTLDLYDPVAGFAGAAAGALLVLGGRRLGLSGRWQFALACAGYACYLVLDTVGPVAPTAMAPLLEGRPPPGQSLPLITTPFLHTAREPVAAALGIWAARAARFVPVGLLLYLGLRRATSRWLGALVVLAGALGLELLQARLGLGPADVTDVLMAGVGMLAGHLAASRLRLTMPGRPPLEEKR